MKIINELNMKPLKSLFWYLDANDWKKEVYSHPAKEQFLREAEKLAKGFLDILTSKSPIYKENKSKEKALIMIYSDLFMSLKDCCFLLSNNKYRLIGTILREFLELMDTAYFIFHQPEKFIHKWYSNDSPKHHELRNLKTKMIKEFFETLLPDAKENKKFLNHLRNTNDESYESYNKWTEFIQLSKIDKEFKGNFIKYYKDSINHEYDSLSKLTHKTYKTLLYQYWDVNNSNEQTKIVLDQNGIINSSKTIFLTLLSSYTVKLLKNFKETSLIQDEQFNLILLESCDEMAFGSGPFGDPDSIIKDFGFDPREE